MSPRRERKYAADSFRQKLTARGLFEPCAHVRLVVGVGSERTLLRDTCTGLLAGPAISLV